MQLHLHQGHHGVADFEGTFTYLKEVLVKGKEGLHVFSELFLTGYPHGDLCFQKGFRQRCLAQLSQIDALCRKLPPRRKFVLLVGGLEYRDKGPGDSQAMANVIYKMAPGKGPSVVCTKMLLPNYDIFDEARYYTPGKEPTILRLLGKQIGLLLCEDMWYSSHYDLDPVECMANAANKKGTNLDLIIVPSASHYYLHKKEERIGRAMEISASLGVPLAYVNKVGGEDGLLFDGASFVVDGKETLAQLPPFERGQLVVDFPSYTGPRPRGSAPSSKRGDSRGFISRPHLDLSRTPPTIRDLSDGDCAETLEALALGLQEYAQKCGFKKFLLALSGGIDSALLVAIVNLSLRKGQSLEVIYMPSEFSSPLSTGLVFKLCNNLNLRPLQFPIKFLHSIMRNSFLSHTDDPLLGASDENIQCRLRGAILYARSNQTGAMVLNTSNRSELAMGYCTLYGDSVGAISPLGDLYKGEIFRLAHYINDTFGPTIPEEIIQRPPSAELRKNQEDSQSLPPYVYLDPILEGLLSDEMDEEDLIKLGFQRAHVEKALDLLSKSEYKRKQFCPIIKVKPRSFGHGRRIPISKMGDCV